MSIDNHENDGAATSTDGLSQSAAPSTALADQEQAFADWENAVNVKNATTLKREERVSSREKAIQCRENAANVRDQIANDREQTADVREGTANNRENNADNSENSAVAREGRADIRDGVADIRDGTAAQRENNIAIRETRATVREKEIKAEETLKAASNHLIIMLQQANAHLVLVSIEAHKMAEQVKVAKDQLAYLAHHDVLTDLPNRILLLDRLNSAIELAGRKGWQLALMFLDLDRFKHVNDSLGHVVGDKLLQSVAERLLVSARHSDTISRQGGDEFVVLLPFIEQRGDAALCAHKLIEALKLPHHITGHDIHVSVSIGISIYPDDGQDAETLMKNADTAMFCAKENKSNKFKFFEAQMNARAVHRHSIEASLHFALKRQEFVLFSSRKSS